MATSIRNKKFTRIGITARKLPQSTAPLKRLIAYLNKEYPQCQIFLNESMQKINSRASIKKSTLPELCAEIDLMICIGGDGTLINTARFSPSL